VRRFVFVAVKDTNRGTETPKGNSGPGERFTTLRIPGERASPSRERKGGQARRGGLPACDCTNREELYVANHDSSDFSGNSDVDA
jgi:hypothetical protein